MFESQEISKTSTRLATGRARSSQSPQSDSHSEMSLADKSFRFVGLENLRSGNGALGLLPFG